MRKYSVFAVAREAMRGHKGWEGNGRRRSRASHMT